MTNESDRDTRGFEIVADVRAVGHMKKTATVSNRGGTFTIDCDEGPQLGGEGSAPSPMQYFVTAVGF